MKCMRMAGIPGTKRIAKLRHVNDQIAGAAGRPARAIDLDDQWRRLLLADCPNQILLGFIDQLIWKSRRYEYAYLTQSSNLEMATSEHEAILAALERSDMSVACKMLKQNMSSAREPLLAWLRAGEDNQ